MARLILLLGAVIGIIMLFRRVLSIAQQSNTDRIDKTKSSDAPNSNQTDTQAGTIDEAILKCSHCGVHSPKSKGLKEGQHFFCSTEHKSKFLSNTKKENTS